MKTLLFTCALAITFATSLSAQTLSNSTNTAVGRPDVPPPARALSLAGPRFGVTFINDDLVNSLADKRNITVKNTMSQFGWQFERQFYSKEDGPTVLNEWVALVGGLDQGVVLPSLSWMVGLRTRDGAEFGIGPNITPTGVALAVAGGITVRSGGINIPMNFAVVPSKEGMRVSMLTGFTLRK